MANDLSTRSTDTGDLFAGICPPGIVADVQLVDEGAMKLDQSVIPESVFTENVAIVGKTGSGKTFAAKGLVEKLLAADRRVCILDPTGVWWGLRAPAAGRKTGGFKITVFGGARGDIPIADTSGAAVAATIAGRNLPAIIDVSELSNAGRTRFATAFFDELYARNRLALTLVLDEADCFAPQVPAPAETTMLSRVEQIVRRGRVRGFRTWTITQRPAVLNKNVLSQADTMIAMKLTAPQDRAAIGRWIEGQADRDAGKKVLGDLPRLQRGEGWLWSASHELLARQTFPAITTYDSSRTPEEGEALPTVTLAEIDVSAIRASLALPVEATKKAKGKQDAVTADSDDGSAVDPVVPKAPAQTAAATREKVAPAGGYSESQVTEAVSRAYEMGRRAGHESGYAEGVAAARLAMRDDMLKLGDFMNDVSQRMESAGRIFVDIKQHLGRLSSVPPEISAIVPGAAPVPAAVDVLNALAAVKAEAKTEAKTKTPKAATADALIPTAIPMSLGSGLPKAERLILIALCQHRKGLSKVRLALLTHYAPNGGGFSNALSALRGKGMITGSADLLVIQGPGLQAVEGCPQPPSGRDLLDYWKAHLGKAERKILDALFEAHPNTLSKNQLAARAGYDAGGGGFNNGLSKLRSLALIHGRVELSPSKEFFA